MCHPKFQDSWAAGAHGRATVDPIFEQSWASQGKPGACLVCHVTGYDPATATWRKDGVACEACHNPIPAEHVVNPATNPVPVDRSPDLCGHCHSDTRFGWDEWQISAHYQRNMSCTVCHDAHSAGLKTIVIADGQALGPSGLCINCHSEVSMNFPYSKHHQASVSCVDCHLRHLEENGSDETHTMPDHSFNASLATCNACHADQMHSSTETAAVPAAEMPAPEITIGKSLAESPSPVSPFGFAGLAGLLGLAGGIALTVFASMLSARLTRRASVDDSLLERIAYFIGWTLVLYLYFRFWDTLSMTYTYQPGRTEGLRLLTAGPLSFNFWVGEILLGIVTPMLLLLYRPTRMSQLWRMVALALVVGGVVAYRWDTNISGLIIVLSYLPGEPSVAYTHYIPSLVEWLAGLGVIAYGLLAFSLGARYLKVVDHRAVEVHETEAYLT